jgi:hypothetical protein
MNLTSYGCSFIFGTDMSDAEMIPGTSGKPSQTSWPALLADHLGLNYRCRAYPGCGNLLIAERILLDITHDRFKQNQLVVVGWSWIDRFDYNDSAKIDNWNTIRPNETTNLSKIYYSQLHSEYRDKLNSLIMIKLVIDTLSQHQIPFIMTCHDHLLFDKQYHTSDSINFLQDFVNPHMIDFDGKTFLDWSQDRGFAISPTLHPLENAHRAAFEYIRTHNFL